MNQITLKVKQITSAKITENACHLAAICLLKTPIPNFGKHLYRNEVIDATVMFSRYEDEAIFGIYFIIKHNNYSISCEDEITLNIIS